MIVKKDIKSTYTVSLSPNDVKRAIEEIYLKEYINNLQQMPTLSSEDEEFKVNIVFSVDDSFNGAICEVSLNQKQKIK